MTPELKSEPVEYVAVPENPGITRKKRDLLSVFLDSSSDEEGEQAAAHFSNSIKQEPSTSGLNVVSRPNGFTFQPPTKPEYQDVDVDALTNVFSEMVVSRHAILLANQWEPVRYEKGAALERIEGCVANMLVSAYTSNETNTSNLLKSGSKFFKSTEEREDANLVEDQLEQLMDRMVGWKISEKTTPQVDDIGNMVAQNKPKYLHISRRISRTAQIDEHARISMNNNLRAFIDHLKKTHPHEQLLIARLDAKEREKPLTEAERNAKIKAFAERETRKYMLNAGEEVVDKSLVVFDYSLLDKAQEKEKAEELPEFSYQHQQVGEVRPFEDEPMHYVSQKTPPVVRQPLRSALKKGTSPPKPSTSNNVVVPPVRKISQMSDRRRQLRQEMGAHLSKQSLVIYVDAQNMPEEQVHGKKRRVTAKKQASSRKSRRVASPPAPRRQQNSSVQQQRQYVRNWQSMVSQRQEQEEEDIDDGYVEEESDVEEVQQQNYRINSSPEPEDDFYEDEDEFGPLILPGPRLISCFKRQNRFSVTGLVRRIVFNEQMTIQEYEIEDGNILAFNPAEGNKRQVAPYVFNGRYTTEEETVSRAYKNLITLPHRDAPVPVMKRYHPNFDNRHSLTELKNEVFESYKAMIEHIEGNSQRRISRWLITDLLLYRLDKRILSNMVVTEIAFPRMPNWLIDDALNKKPDLFPKEISYIFVACGFDFEMQYSRDNSAKPFNFLSKLNEWLQKNVGDKKAVYTKHVYPNAGPDADYHPVVPLKCSLYKRIPTIVAITIPEVGDYSGQFEQFNQRLRDHVEMLKERSGPDRAYFDLLDWAELVNQSTDPDDTETVEGRTRLLMEHMANEYGILFNPIAKESDEE